MKTGNEMTLSFDWNVKGIQFSEDRMFTRIRTIAKRDGLKETYRALYYARKAHSGQYRKKQKYSSEVRLPSVFCTMSVKTAMSILTNSLFQKLSDIP